MRDIARARALLAEDTARTLALVRGGEEETDVLRGVQPLLARLDGGKDYSGFSAADRIVGRAAAFLYVLLGVKEVYAEVLSRAGEEVLQTYKIAYGCGILVDGIVNRAGTGPCPMELATEGICDPVQALAAIRAKRDALQGKARG